MSLVPVAELRARVVHSAVERAPVVARPRVAQADITAPETLEALARRIIAGEHPARAAEVVGLPAELGPHLVRNSLQYKVARDRVLAATSNSDEAVLVETRRATITNAHKAALVQADLLDYCQDPQVLARVSDSALDRVGLRAPAKTDNTHRVELSERTIALIRTTLTDLKQIEALEAEWTPVFHNPTSDA